MGLNFLFWQKGAAINGATSLNSSLQEERPGNMLLLLAILVILLHVLGIMWLLRPPLEQEPATQHAQPFKLEVSMLTIAGPKASAVPQQATPQAKPIPKKTPPVERNQPALNATERIIKTKPAEQKTQIVKSQSTLQTAQTVTSAVIETQSKNSSAKDNFPLSDLRNPSPEYPEMAIFLGYQGNAIVRIHVSAKGLSDGVEIVRSSGHKILDESAAKALRKWRFIPNKRGETAVADSVMVSVIFTLHD